MDTLLFQQMSDASKHITYDIFSFRKTEHWCIVHAAQSNCCGSRFSTSFLLNHAAPNSEQPELNALTTRSRESCSSVNMSRESKRLKKSRSDWLNSSNALIQHLSEKIRFSCFPVLSGSAEAHVTSGGIATRFYCLLYG